MDDNPFTPIVVDDPSPRQKPPRDRRFLVLQISTAICVIFWTLGILGVLMMINGNWHAASSIQRHVQDEATR